MQHGGATEALWTAVGQAFGADAAARLRLDLQLAVLTLNNTPLIRALHEADWEPPLATALDLVRRGYYQPAKWAALLDGQPAPPGLPGATAAERRSGYADLLAAQLRAGFPTAAVAELVRSGAAPLRGAAQHAVYDFLYTRQGEFDLGAEPVERFLARTGQAGTVARPVVDEVKRLQRVYQVTPSDQAFTALLRDGLDSAYQITRYDQAGFVRAYGSEMGGNDAAVQTYARAHRVYSAVLNVAATYLIGQRAPRLGSGATGLIDHGQLALTADPSDGTGPGMLPVIAAGPTLEELFGSLDYCQCDDCRSILSPAAYLVDLLDYLDSPPGVPGNPLDVLLSRRPDLQYLPLTCDNTNVALPYIDIVNETLEYFVCNNLSLAALPTGMVGAAYPASSLTASGGTPPYTWTGTPPAGLALSADGTITGTPSASGTTEFTVTVADSTAPAALISTAQLSITVLPPVVVTTPPQLPAGQVGVAYPATVLAAAGGTPPYTWTGTPPPGLALSADGTITRTPSESGTTEFTVTVADSTAPAALSGTGQLTITVASPPSSALAVTTPAGLPAGQAGSSYPATTLTAAGGILPYTWALQSGSLPAGLIFSAGVISGTPTAEGTTEFTVAVTDSASPAQTATQQTWISVASGLTIGATPLPPGQVGVVYSGQELSVLGGTSPYTWSLQPGSSLPTGLTLSAGGTISGTPTAGGTTMFVVSVADSTPGTVLTATQPMSISVASALSVGPLGYAGHNTDDSISSAELLASPQFVNDPVYATLQETWFPPPLPFHRPLEQLRQYFALFGVPLQDATVALLPASSMAAWTAILSEQLGLSPPEYQLLTDHWLGLAPVYGYPPTTTDQAAVAALSSVQDFCRRIGIAYDDLFSILGTRFVNPATALLTRLEALNVPFATLMNLNASPAANTAAFLQALPPGLDQAAYDNGNVAGWVTSNYDQIMRLITVVDSTGGTDLCTAADLELRYANPDPTVANGVPAYSLHAIDFFRLLRFIRLWQKLGLSIELTDDVIGALYPAADLPTGNDSADLRNLDDGFETMLVRLGFAYRLLDMLGLDPGSALQQVLACWAPIGITGANSLYQQIFFASSTLQPDPAFAPNQYGDILTDGTQTLLGHEPALRAALNLTGSELALIATALGFDVTTPLTLENVSALYRRGWLARALRLSVMELLDLIDFSGLDPFAPPDLVPPPLAPVAPHITGIWGHGRPPLPPLSPRVLEPPAIRFVRLVQSIQAASMTPAQALYLIWNHDTSGTAGPTEQDATSLAATLRSDFAAVASQFTLVDDPTGAIAQQLMTLVYGTGTSDFFFGLINGTMSTTTRYSDPRGTLSPAVLAAASGRLSYDDLRKQLSYAGVLDQAALTAVENAAGSDTALLAALAALSAANHQAVDPFFATYPELRQAYHDYVASDDTLPAKRTALLAEILSDLTSLRQQEQALAAVTSAAGTDPSFAPAILNDPTVLHAAVDPVQAAVADLTAIEAPGLAAQFYLSNDPAATPDISLDSVSALSYAPCVTGAAQTVLVAGPITPGDVLTTIINGVGVPYDIVAGDTTPAILAAHVAEAIGAAAVPDPAAGLPLSSVVSAAGPPGAITITPSIPALPLTLACAASTAGSGTYAAAGQSPAQQATVTGPFAVGDVLTTTLNGVAVGYTVQAGDTAAAIIASNIASAINQAAEPEPTTGLPLNKVVSASGPDGTVTIKAVTAAAPLTVACSQSLPAARSYTAGPPVPASQTAAVSGTATHGNVLTTTVNGIAIPYTVLAADTTLAIVTDHIAAAINATTTPEPRTGQPLNTVIAASSSGGMIAVTAGAFGPAVTVACSASPAATESYAAGPAVAASQTATVAGAITPGDELTTTINGIAIPYPVVAADSTLAILADHVAAAVNATTTADPNTGQPLNTVLTASSTGDVITIAALPPGNAFTVGCALAPGSYAAAGEVTTSATAVVSGAITAGDVLTTTVNGIAIPYTVQATDTTVTIASQIAGAINAAATADPATGQPLNTVVTASQAGGVITVTAAGTGVAVGLACALSPQATEGYATGPAATAWQAVVAGGFVVGDVLTTTVNGTDIPYPVAAADVTPAIIAGHIAVAVNADTTPDPASGLPLNSIIRAVSVGSTVLIKAASPSFTLMCTLSPGATETCTVADELPVRPGGGVIAADWYGYIDVPQDGYYDVRVYTDPGASVSLEIDGTAVTMASPPGGSLWSNQTPISLSAGSLTAVALTVTSLATTMAVSWESTGLGWQAIPGAYLYSGTLVTRIQSAYSRFVKATSLATTLSLTADEIAYLGADPDLAVSGQPWLNVLPTAGSPDPAFQTAAIGGTTTTGDMLTTTINGVTVPYTVAATDTSPLILAESIATAVNAITTPDPFTGLPLNDVVTASSATGATGVVTFTAVTPGSSFAVACTTSPAATETYAAGPPVPGIAAGLTAMLGILLDYARVKAALSPSDERVLAVVQDPTIDALTALTGWDPVSVGALLQQLFGNTLITNIGHVENLRRLYDAYAIVTASGISADRLIPAVTTSPTPAIADGLQAAVRSRYAETDWLAVVQPINDTLRDLQRDALVAYILQQLGDQGPASPLSAIDTADKLYEYLLMDVQMEPCMQTSRVRHAMSSVQLFTEMCLRNLIPQVSPQDIPPGWDWRKRYRVWQANREVFLWPENWLDPEFRTDQSAFFTQTLGELLQGDMTNDAATAAYLGYLTNLESVAKLEPSGMWYDGANGDVIARTAGASRQYYHRRLVGASWTPWDEVKLGIEDNPVVPYVWNGRLLLFWLRLAQQSPTDGTTLLGAASGATAANTGLMNLTYGDMFPTTAQAAASTVVNVGAILCYSEYLNGQWQPGQDLRPASADLSRNICRRHLRPLPDRTGHDPGTAGLGAGR